MEQGVEYWKELALRNQAEIENIKKRFRKQLSEAESKTVDQIAKDLLEVIDNLYKAREHGIEGAEGTLVSLEKTFEKYGIKHISPQSGEKFDPEVHEALATAPSPDHIINQIIEVIQLGYHRDGKLIRPAKVIVCSETLLIPENYGK